MARLKKRADGLYQQSITIPSGKRKVFYGKTIAEINRKIAEYQYGVTKGPLFSDAADGWQEKHGGEITYKTRKTHEAPVKRAKDYFEGKYVQEITAPEITAFVRSIEAMGRSKRTVQLHLDVVNMIYNYAISEMGAKVINPCASITLSPHLKQTTRSLAKKSDIDAIKAHYKDDRFSLLPYFLMYTGLRIGEALALTREDFDFKKNTININKKVSWQPNQPVIEDYTKTPRGIRKVPLLNVVKEALPTEWSGYLFEHDGKPYTQTRFRREWERYAKRTGVTCDRHTLRHEFATLLLDADVSVKEAARITGHDERVLQKTYQHIRDEREAEAANKLNAMIDGKSV